MGGVYVSTIIERCSLADDGPLAQLVERHVYTVDVIGSSPVGPTVITTVTKRMADLEFFASSRRSHPHLFWLQHPVHRVTAGT